MQDILMDGIRYRVRIVYNTLTRSFELRSGENDGYMLSGRHERDLTGTAYIYEMAVEPDPAHPEDYDAFYHAVTAPVDSHSVTMPYGQETLSFQAEVTGGEDTWRGMLAGKNRWTGLKVRFSPISLQRRSM